MVLDDNGNVNTYRRVSPLKPRQRVNHTVKSKTPKKKPSPTELANSLPQCQVVLKNLSDTDIIEKQVQIERDGKLRAIKEKIKTLPRNIFLDNIQLMDFLIIFLNTFPQY